MSFSGYDLRTGLSDVGKGLEAIAKAIAKHQPVTYNIVINTPHNADPEKIAETVKRATDTSTDSVGI